MFQFLHRISLSAGCLLVLIFASCSEVKRTAEQTVPQVENADSLQKEGRVRLLFAGDAMCHTPQVSSARRNGRGKLDFTYAFAGVKSYFERADIAVVNFETTISPNGQYSGFPRFRTPAQYADALRWLGVDVAVMANNHCCDGGEVGIRTTIAKFDTLGIAHTGVYLSKEEQERNPILYLEHDGVKLAIVNYTYGTNGIPVPRGCRVNHLDKQKMTQDIQRATENVDCVVACVHWGYEYHRQPSSEQRSLAQFLHDNGVDIIVGTHPHVIQPYVASDEQITLYSLGNFISNQKQPHTDGGLLAEIEVVKGRDGKCRYSLNTVPVWVKIPGHKLVSPETADSEPMAQWQRVKYERFIKSTAQLLNGGVRK